TYCGVNANTSAASLTDTPASVTATRARFRIPVSTASYENTARGPNVTSTFPPASYRSNRQGSGIPGRVGTVVSVTPRLYPEPSDLNNFPQVHGKRNPQVTDRHPQVPPEVWGRPPDREPDRGRSLGEVRRHLPQR